MGQSSNYEPRRLFRSAGSRSHRVRCASCGARAHAHSADLPFCHTCLEWARQNNLAEWDDLGAGD